MNDALDSRASETGFSRDARGGSRIGVLLVNLGTPEATDPRSVRIYLREFLSDRRVIETPRWLWLPILNLIVLPFRARRSGAAYARIWNREANESPLKTITRTQAQGLGDALGHGDDVAVDWAMRYGQPSIASRLDALLAAGCDRVLLFPLYPQYSATTTASVQDAAFAAMGRLRNQPALRSVAPYWREPVYIDALAASMHEAIGRLDFEPEVVLLSYHGLPVSYVERGDPYRDHCETTTRLLRARLGWDEAFMPMTYQSRFGRTEWLQPYTAERVAALAKAGVRRLAVATPGFAADCIETLAEIGIENAHIFKAAGGADFAALPCLNAGREGIAMLADLVRRNLAGWL